MSRMLMASSLLLVCLFGTQGQAAVSVEEQVKACLQKHETDGAKRLDCYDEVTRRIPTSPDSPSAPKSATVSQLGSRISTSAPVTKPGERTAGTAETAAVRKLEYCRHFDYDGKRLRCYDDEAGYSDMTCRVLGGWWIFGGECVPSSACEEIRSSYLKDDGFNECRTTCNDSNRLKHYDSRIPRSAPETPKVEPGYLSSLWLLDNVSRQKEGRWAILPHQENYFLLYTYNGALDKQPYESVNPGTHLQNAEAKFQLSLKMKLLEDILGTNMDLWAAYTQLSLWQLWNFNNSAPFRETNYQPEAILNIPMDHDLFDGWKLRFIQIVPINHQSNGQSEPLSRSWNRSMLNFGVEKVNLNWITREDSFDVLLKAWYRWPESAENDDNPSISSYLGYGELWAGYRWKNDESAHHFGLMFRNNLRFDGENRSTLQLGYDRTLVGPLNLYVQYFTGYGETLIDYNHYTNRIGAGVLIRNW